MLNFKHICIIFLISLILNSCASTKRNQAKLKVELAREIEFIYTLMDDPEQIEELIKTSEYYDGSAVHNESDFNISAAKNLLVDAFNPRIGSLHTTNIYLRSNQKIYWDSKVINVYVDHYYNGDPMQISQFYWRITFIFGKEEARLILLKIFITYSGDT